MEKNHYLRDFIQYALLNVMGMIGLSCYILADTFFISKGLGADGLTALNLAIPIYSFIHGSGLMIGMGGSTWYAIRKSQERHEDANQAFTLSVALAAVFSALFILVGAFLPGEIIALFGVDGRVFEMSRLYLQVILLFSPAFLMNNVLLCFVRNDGAPHLSMAAMLGGSLSNVALDWIFIFPCNMGIFGAVLATGLAPLISMMILSPHFILRKNCFHLTKHRGKNRMLMGVLESGLPSLVSEVSSGAVMMAFNAIILNLSGNVGVAAYGVIANLSLVVMAMYTGIAQGVQPLVSRGHGLKDFGRVNITLRYGLTAMLGLSVIIYVAVFGAASQIAQIFNSEQNPLLQSMAVQGLRLYFIACPFAGFNVIVSTWLTCVERPRPAQVLSLLRGFILILPMAFLLSWIWGIQGVWCAFPASEIITAALGLAFLSFSRKKSGILRT